MDRGFSVFICEKCGEMHQLIDGISPLKCKACGNVFIKADKQVNNINKLIGDNGSHNVEDHAITAKYHVFIINYTKDGRSSYKEVNDFKSKKSADNFIRMLIESTESIHSMPTWKTSYKVFTKE